MMNLKRVALVATVAVAALSVAAVQSVDVVAKAGKGKAGKAPVTVSITIPEGYHIYGPKETMGIPTSIKVKGSDVKVVKTAFPKTKTYSQTGATFQVYESKVAIPVVLQSTKKGVQKVSLLVKSQACNDRVCLPWAEKTIVLNVDFGK